MIQECLSKCPIAVRYPSEWVSVLYHCVKNKYKKASPRSRAASWGGYLAIPRAFCSLLGFARRPTAANDSFPMNFYFTLVLLFDFSFAVSLQPADAVIDATAVAW